MKDVHGYTRDLRGILISTSHGQKETLSKGLFGFRDLRIAKYTVVAYRERGGPWEKEIRPRSFAMFSYSDFVPDLIIVLKISDFGTIELAEV